MPLVIADETLQEVGLEPHTARIEFACHWYFQGRMAMPAAARLAGLSRMQFEDELHSRGITAYPANIENVRADLQALQSAGQRQ